MTKKTGKRSLISRMLGDRGGNFGLMTAFALPVILAAGGVAMDLTNMVLTKAELQDAADSAALAASSALSNDKKSVADAKDIAEKFFKTQMSTSQMDGATAKVDIEETVLSGGGKAFKVSVASSYTVEFNPLTRLLGQTSTAVAAGSTAESATGSKNAVSMFLVLDRSGSMSFKTDEIGSKTVACQNFTESNWGRDPYPTTPCYIRKIAALKTAVAGFAKVLDTVDPKKQYVRTGAISYNDETQKESSLDWGTDGALKYVNALPDPTSGGTDSHTAFATAVSKLLAVKNKLDVENEEHRKKNGLTPLKYIVFMTDGENTSYDKKATTANANKSDTETMKSCNAARDAGIAVYTVAFMAPTRGQTLLKNCATTTANYYEAENMAGLIDAFEEIGKSAAAAMSRLTQ